METILRKLGMETFISRFVKEKIYPGIVGKLSKYELTSLGLANAADLMKLRVECIKHGNAEIVGAGTSFKKEYNVSEDILEHLIEADFSMKDMATLLSISESTYTEEEAGTSEEWAYFESRWSDYVEATKIAGRDKVVQLLECCDEQLRKDLTRSAGGSLTNKPVQEMLAAIKKLAVREENTMMARVTLHNMRQDRDEPCPACNTDVNYTDTIIRDVLARGISNPEIQLDLLGDKNQDMTLEEVTQFVEAKDSWKRSASRLLDSLMVEAVSSSYKKAKQTAVRDKNEVCSYCGKKVHGKSASARLRKSDCPAYGHKCGYCNPVNTTLKSISSDSHKIHGRTLAIDHHLYDNLSDTWISKASQPQPFVNLDLRILPKDYEAFGLNMTKRTNTVAISAMADTGCQSCLVGIKVIHRLGINQTELYPVNMKMHAANNKGITILGATILRISGKDDQGRHVETRQMTYVTDNSDKLFISREACIALRMISDSFPTIGEIDDTQQTPGTENPHNIMNNIRSFDGLHTTCNCP
ncbi:unnamed protein product [Mytilus coruscus]|uniref:Uncharacterized protein n=1 Tax=Mytilus coruscus TaxID=42192 RepID=A0A6J8C7S5_MYTCO|nr:unnamed protein product [Mytilus coruscus]